MSLNAVIGQGFRDFETIAGVNDVKLYGGVHPCLLIEMLSGLPINISTAFLIFISEWGILSVEK